VLDSDKDQSLLDVLVLLVVTCWTLMKDQGLLDVLVLLVVTCWTLMKDPDLLVLSPLLVLACSMTDSLLKQVLNSFTTFVTSNAVQSSPLMQMI